MGPEDNWGNSPTSPNYEPTKEELEMFYGITGPIKKIEWSSDKQPFED
jgi:hypothetical protein